MKCFIHSSKEAISVCTKCGKAMCDNCSAYSNHSGICPECKRESLIELRNFEQNKLNENKLKMRNNIIYAIIFVVLAIIVVCTINVLGLIILIGSAIFAIKVLLIVNKRKPIEIEISRLTEEINKLTEALHKGTAEI